MKHTPDAASEVNNPLVFVVPSVGFLCVSMALLSSPKMPDAVGGGYQAVASLSWLDQRLRDS